jgi:hypothetical protein
MAFVPASSADWFWAAAALPSWLAAEYPGYLPEAGDTPDAPGN